MMLKLDLRAPSNKDAILNLMCDGDVKAVFAYDSSETKTYLAAYASIGTSFTVTFKWFKNSVK